MVEVLERLSEDLLCFGSLKGAEGCCSQQVSPDPALLFLPHFFFLGASPPGHEQREPSHSGTNKKNSCPLLTISEPRRAAPSLPFSIAAAVCAAALFASCLLISESLNYLKKKKSKSYLFIYHCFLFFLTPASCVGFLFFLWFKNIQPISTEGMWEPLSTMPPNRTSDGARSFLRPLHRAARARGEAGIYLGMLWVGAKMVSVVF